MWLRSGGILKGWKDDERLSDWSRTVNRKGQSTSLFAAIVVNGGSLNGFDSGAKFRLDTIHAYLASAGVAPIPIAQASELPNNRTIDILVGASWPTLREFSKLQSRARLSWFDACDSTRKLRLTRSKAGEVSQMLALARDLVNIRRCRADLVTYISEADLSIDEGHWADSNIDTHVLPMLWPKVNPKVATGPRQIVFMGDGRYPPNQRAASWILRVLGPSLARLEVPNPIEIFGQGYPFSDTGNVHFRGYVDDESLIFRRGDIHIAPMFDGAGIKSKVAIPLCAGLQVVATPMGASGIVRSDGLFVVEIDEFAQTLARLISQHQEDLEVFLVSDQVHDLGFETLLHSRINRLVEERGDNSEIS